MAGGRESIGVNTRRLRVKVKSQGVGRRVGYEKERGGRRSGTVAADVRVSTILVVLLLQQGSLDGSARASLEGRKVEYE